MNDRYPTAYDLVNAEAREVWASERHDVADPTCGEHEAVVVAAWAAGRHEEQVSEQ